MSKFLKGLSTTALCASFLAAPAMADKMGLGRTALPEEIAAWNLDVSPDGTGLPAGSGSAYDGEEIFAEHCAVCHGDFAEGVDNWPKLAGGADTLADEDPLKTVGSYWPHLSTAWDYVNRSMPFGNAQSLAPDDVYAIVAYILYSNDLVDDDFVLSNENFLDVEMPNAEGFILDDRDTSEAHFWKAEPCMSNCKDAVEITMRATVLDVTPDEGESTEEEAKAEVAPVAEVVVAALDAELVAKGEKVFKKCKACHQVGEGAKNKSGPQLNNILGRPLGAIEGFKYSKAMSQMGADGQVWDEEALAAFLTKPKDYVKRTKMSFAGLKKEADIAAITEFLKSVSE
jgi:S-disulfanyl-L-cysteine oxidoreductase SoxD